MSRPVSSLRTAPAWLALAAVVACASTPYDASVDATDPVRAREKPWTSLEVDDSHEDFDFVVVTDRTGGHRPGVFASAMPKVNLLKPAFVMSVGDLIEGYSEDRAVLEAEWEEFDGMVEQLEMPFFYLGGNHDLSNETMAELWRERLGPSYYHFVYKDVLFLALNSELFSMVSHPGESLPGPDSQAEQMAYVERVLAEHADVRWTLVFVHQPLWDSSRVHPDWTTIEGWLGERPHTVFAGHYHAYTLHERQSRDYITLATTGGGSRLRGKVFGEFDHVALVSMREEGPVIANLMLDGIESVDVRDAELRSVVSRLETAVRAEPMQFDGDDFRRGVVQFQVHNDGDAPLELSGTVAPSRDLAADLPEVALRVGPNSVGELAIPVTAVGPTPFEALAPATVSWTLRTLGPAFQELEIESRSLILPEREFPCYAPRRTPEIDGRLREWDTLALVADPPAVVERNPLSDRDDGSFRFDVRCDARFLYLGIAVRDESIVSSPDKTARRQDGVSLQIDARDDPERSSTRPSYHTAMGDGSLKALLTVGAGPEPSPADDPVFGAFVPKQDPSVRTATRVGPNGYDVEIAVPIELLDAAHGERFDRVRLELSVNDFDEGEPGHSILWWRPSRFGAQAIPGSGTFVRP